MGREIKFRFWWPQTKSMVSNPKVEGGRKLTSVNRMFSVVQSEVEDKEYPDKAIVMQFTGLKDKAKE